MWLRELLEISRAADRQRMRERVGVLEREWVIMRCTFHALPLADNPCRCEIARQYVYTYISPIRSNFPYHRAIRGPPPFFTSRNMERPRDRQRQPKNNTNSSLRPPPAPVSRIRNNGRLPPKSPSPSLRSKVKHARADFSPLPWNLAFEEHLFVEANDAKFSFYTAGNVLGQPIDQPVLVLFHGGGCTALSFCAVVKRIREDVPVIAFDQRAHGLTTSHTGDNDIHIDTLVDDAIAAISGFFEKHARKIPSLILAGHSMGGGVVTHVAHSKKLPVTATILIDVTEGTAIEALPYMNTWVTNRPTTFSRISGAIEYVIARGHVRNLESARFSVPSQLVQLDTEDDIDDGKKKWTWRTDLRNTQQFWKSWFINLSDLFLSAPIGPKLLVLAGVDRLDKKLTIGQMQGKFQNILIPEAGHTIHEDQPDKMANVIREFLNRNLITADSPGAPIPNIFQQRKLIDKKPSA